MSDAWYSIRGHWEILTSQRGRSSAYMFESEGSIFHFFINAIGQLTCAAHLGSSYDLYPCP